MIEAIHLVEPTPGLEVLGIKTVASEHIDYQLTRRYPPSGIPAKALREPEGTVVPATGRHVQIVIGIRAPTPGRHGFDAIDVDYRVGDERFRARLTSRYVFCAPRAPDCTA